MKEKSRQKDKTYNERVPRFRDSVRPIKVTGQSYRAINNWESNGLLENARPQKSGWRRFNLKDLVWIRIISDLRSFGYPLKKLKLVKDRLWMAEEGKESLLDQLILSFTKLDYKLLLVYPNGDIKVLPSLNTKSMTKLHTHICIDLSEMLEFVVEKELQIAEKIKYKSTRI